MIVYLVDKETKEIKDTYYNVILFTENSITFNNNRFPGKIFCSDTEYFTNNLKEEDNNDREN